ncbi:hypothetical protein [Spirochaeta cellobiosiphila]|uniref:hypothetical protein n=1 Tax=Spirochaeta cellobiosiphila TaxID=504483 RepID=UPI00048F2118|nr:hypothetical protein [Spirochaeta cellobiosiphila]
MKKAFFILIVIFFSSCSQQVLFISDPYFTTLYGGVKELNKELKAIKDYRIRILDSETIDGMSDLSDLPEIRIFTPLSLDQYEKFEKWPGQSVFLRDVKNLKEGQVSVLSDRGPAFRELGQLIRTWAEDNNVRTLGGVFYTGTPEAQKEWDAFVHGLGEGRYWQGMPQTYTYLNNRNKIKENILKEQNLGIEAYVLFAGQLDGYLWDLVDSQASYIFTENRKKSGIGGGKVLWSIEDDLGQMIRTGLEALESKEYSSHKVRSKIQVSE